MQPIIHYFQNNAEAFHNDLLQNRPADRLGIPRSVWVPLMAACCKLSYDMASTALPLFLANVEGCGRDGNCLENVLLWQDPGTTASLVFGGLICILSATQLINEANREFN